MIEYSAQVNAMCPITKGPKHGPAPIPEEGQWVKAYKIEDISGYTSGCGSDRTGDLEGKTGEERRRMKRCRQVKFLEEWCSIFWMLQKAVG